MWRANGLSEAYLYLDNSAQLSSFYSMAKFTTSNITELTYGNSFGRGAFNFTKGIWNRINQTITLNTFNVNGSVNADGSIKIEWQGAPIISYDSVIWRTLPNVTFTGIQWETFFGGSSDPYNTPTNQTAYFKDLTLEILK